MFGAKYSRAKFWIISIILLFPALFINMLIKATESKMAADTTMEEVSEPIMLYLVLIAISLVWINTLANRIRDYGGNPWLSLLGFLPLVNIVMAFYYGIVQYGSKQTESQAG